MPRRLNTNRRTSTRSKYIPFGGGLDVTSPPLDINPGKLIACNGFEPDWRGGYRVVKGYDRFDGLYRPYRQGFFWFLYREKFIWPAPVAALPVSL